MLIRRLCRLARPVCVTTAAAMLLGPIAPGLLQAQDRSAAIGRVRMNAAAEKIEAKQQAAEAAVTVRLQHVSATWEKVLNQVASDAGLMLVLHDTPPGRFTRNDFRKHTLDEALRILNRDLEPMGFRALSNDKFLTVIRAEQARAEYPRREIQRVSGTESGTGSGVQTAGLEEAAGSATPLFQSSEALPPAGQAGTARSADVSRIGTSVRLAPKNRPAIEISRDIYTAFENRCTIQEQGPHGLPAFTVWRDAQQQPAGNAVAENRSGEWFVVELDTTANMLVVTGQTKATNSVGELVRRLDSVPRTEGEATKLVAGDRGLTDIGKQLQPQLGKLKGDGAAQPRRVAWQPEGQLDPTLPGADGANPLPPGLPPGIDPLMGNLRGDVLIQSVDDLNLLILRGNEADVDQVLQVIDLIERMAQGSKPGIRLHTLEHVSSEALSTLLSDVYERLNTQEEDQGRKPPTINVVPVVQPNAILILAPEGALEDIVALAEELDKPADPATEVNVFRLKHAIASQVVTLLEDFYEDRPGLGTRVRVIADPRTNSLIIQARPRELAEVELLLKNIDKDETGATHQVQVFPLKNAAASELAEFLTTALQSVISPTTTTQQGGGGGGGANQNSQQLRDTKSVVLEFLQTNGDVKRLVKSGLLTDIRINGDPRTNTLMVTAPKGSLAMIESLVRALDQPSSAVASVKMIPLKNASATVAVDLLTELFEPQQEGDLGVQLAGAESASSLVPLRFQADPRSNTVIAYGTEEALIMVEGMLLRLDSGDLRDRKYEVVKLRNAPAADAAAAINSFLQSQRDLLTLDSDLVSTYELLEQEVIVTAEPVNNYLLIGATPRYYDRIMAMVQELDSAPPQVMIQALLVEVELDDSDEFGIELGFQDPLLFARSTTASGDLTTTQTTNTAPNGVATTTTNIISQTGSPGFRFNTADPLGNNLAATPAIVASQALANFGLGRTNADLGFGGLVLAASSQSVSVLIRALASRRNVRVLSRPQIIALDNQEARIQVGQSVPTVGGFNTNAITGVATPTVEYRDAGVILTVTPRISPEGDIVLNTVAEKSTFTESNFALITDSTGNVINAPLQNITNATTTVKIPDGQTVVMGGMISKSDTTIERKVPLLGDIPVIKTLFRYDSHAEKRTELLIFLTPRIIRGDGDAELVKQVEAERIHFFEEEAEAIHGPLFAVPPEDLGLPMMDGQWSRDVTMPVPDAIFTEPRSAPGMYPGPAGMVNPTPIR